MISAIEALAVALLSAMLIAVVTLLVWWLTFDLEAAPEEVFAIIAQLWQFTHLVPMGISVDAATALSFGLPAEDIRFVVSIVPLGLTLITVVLAARAGVRFAQRGGEGAWAIVGAFFAFSAASVMVNLFVTGERVWPAWLTVVVPALVYALCMAASFLVRAMLIGHEWCDASISWLVHQVARVAKVSAGALPERSAEVFRLALAAFAVLIGFGAVATTLNIVLGYTDMVAVAQGLQLNTLSSLLMFVIQLLLLPIAWVWSVAWLSGAGFSFGVATTVSPFETLLGPLPALPLLGALPGSWGWAGALAPALLVAAATALGGLAAARPVFRRASSLAVVSMSVAAAILAGAAITLLAALTSGSLGPGRLTSVGPEPWLVGGLVALELAFGLSLGVFARRVDVQHVREAVPQLATLERLRRSAAKSSGDAPAVTHTGSQTAEHPTMQSTGDEWVEIDLTETLDLSSSVDAAETVDLSDAVSRDSSLDAAETVDLSETMSRGETAEAQPKIVHNDLDEDELTRAFSWEQFDPTDDDKRR